MTKKPVIVILILLGLCYVGESYAQKQEISLDLGIGNGGYADSRILPLPFYKDFYTSFYQIGGKYALTTNDELVSFYTGLTLDNKVSWETNRSMTYLKAPIGFHLNYGSRFCFVIGGGVNMGLLLRENLGYHDYRNFSFGTFLKAGPAYQITDKYRLMLTYQANFDVTVMYVEHGHSFGGSPTDHIMKGYDGFLLLSLYKKIGKKA